MRKSCLFFFCTAVFVGIFCGVVQSKAIDCTGKTYKAGDHKMSVNVDGKSRTFIMHVPSAYKGDEPVPLVVDYHPIGGSGEGQLGDTKYKALTDPEGVISLYPDGTGKSGGMGNGWNVGPCCSNDDDVKFTREMIKAVEEKVCIDKQRVYATGFSMGGGMANHVACFMSDIFAAVAPAAMDLNKVNSAKCNPVRPISVISFRGTADPVCRYQGGDSGFNDGLNFLGAEGNFRFWAEKNGCQGTPTKNSDGCDEYSNCKNGTKVVLCTKQNGGHEQGDGTIGWPFLKQFTLLASDPDTPSSSGSFDTQSGSGSDSDILSSSGSAGTQSSSGSSNAPSSSSSINPHSSGVPASSTKQNSLELSSVLTVNVALVVITIAVTLVSLL